MNLEQLQIMSDDELNELAATKVMGWEKQGEVFIDGNDIIFNEVWNPTTDMNDAYGLLKQFMDWEINISRGLNDWICRLSEGVIEDAVNVEAQCESLPRAITIATSCLASILAKGE